MRDFVDSKGKFWQDAMNKSKRRFSASNSQLSPLIFEDLSANHVRNAIGEWERFGSEMCVRINSNDSKDSYVRMNSNDSKDLERADNSKEKIVMSPESFKNFDDMKDALDVAIKRVSSPEFDGFVCKNNGDDFKVEEKVNDGDIILLGSKLSFNIYDIADSINTVISPCLQQRCKEVENKEESAEISFNISTTFDIDDIVSYESPIKTSSRRSFIARAQANNVDNTKDPVGSIMLTYKLPTPRLPKVPKVINTVSDIYISEPLVVDLFKLGDTHYYKHFNKTSMEIMMIQMQKFTPIQMMKSPVVLSCRLLPLDFSPTPLEFYAITETFSTGETFVVLTIHCPGCPEGYELNSNYYGIKRIIISSPDDLWPLLELQVDLLPQSREAIG
jgi:hypothetical protein